MVGYRHTEEVLSTEGHVHKSEYVVRWVFRYLQEPFKLGEQETVPLDGVLLIYALPCHGVSHGLEVLVVLGTVAHTILIIEIAVPELIHSGEHHELRPFIALVLGLNPPEWVVDRPSCTDDEHGNVVLLTLEHVR